MFVKITSILFMASTEVCVVDAAAVSGAEQGHMDERTLYIELGRAIAARRKTLAMTQASLAKAVGLSRPSVANIEVGRQNVLVHQLYRIADALQMTPAQLLPLAGSAAKHDRPLSVVILGDYTSKQRAQIEQVYSSITPPKLVRKGD